MCIKLKIAVCLCAFCLLSCSVKSEREQCPSLLFLSVLGGEDKDVFVSISGEDYETMMHIGKSDGVAVAGVDLKKGRFNLSVRSGARNEWDGVIVVGEEMPQLYACAESILCTSDVTEVTAHLDKQFCRLKVKVVGIECSALIRGNVCGIDLWDMSPISGHFYAQKEALMSGNELRLFDFSVPRQKDASLMLDLLSGQELLCSFELGQELLSAGMDWSRPSLEDMEVCIQYCETGFELLVKNWVQVEI